MFIFQKLSVFVKTTHFVRTKYYLSKTSTVKFVNTTGTHPDITEGEIASLLIPLT